MNVSSSTKYYRMLTPFDDVGKKREFQNWPIRAAERVQIFGYLARKIKGTQQTACPREV